MKAIEISNLVKRYGNFTALRDVSLEVNIGDSWAILGPNGAGKTTLIRIISGQAKPTGGEVKVFGVSSNEFTEEIKRRIGILSHNHLLYEDLTAWENLIFYGRLYGVEGIEDVAEDMLRKMGLIGRADDPVRTFSRGMKQKLAIARALIHSPDLVILDEPTSGLDVRSRKDLADMVSSLKRDGKTVLFTTHNLEEVSEFCSYVAILHRGRLLGTRRVGGEPLEDYYLRLVEDASTH